MFLQQRKQLLCKLHKAKVQIHEHSDGCRIQLDSLTFAQLQSIKTFIQKCINSNLTADSIIYATLLWRKMYKQVGVLKINKYVGRRVRNLGEQIKNMLC